MGMEGGSRVDAGGCASVGDVGGDERWRCHRWDTYDGVSGEDVWGADVALSCGGANDICFFMSEEGVNHGGGGSRDDNGKFQSGGWAT